MHFLSLSVLCFLPVFEEVSITQVVTKAFVRELPSTVYESSIPLIYKLPITEPKQTHAMDFIKGACADVTHQQCALLLMAVEQLEATKANNQLLERAALLSPMLRTVPTNQVSHKRTLRDLLGHAIGAFAHYCCDIVTVNEVQELIANDEAVTDYVSKMQNSLITDHKDLIQIRNYTATLARQTKEGMNNFHDFLNNFTNVQLEIKGELDRNLTDLSHQTTMVGVITAHAAQYLHWLTETIKHHDIVQHCRNQQIPLTIADMTTLTKDLKTLSRKVREDGYDLAIPLDRISKYYTIPISTCRISTSQIVVRINVPIIKSVDVYK